MSNRQIAPSQVAVCSLTARIANDLETAFDELLTLTHAPDLSIELIERIFRFFDLPAELIRFEAACFTATGAVQLVVVLNPSDRFRNLMAAVRAGNV